MRITIPEEERLIASASHILRHAGGALASSAPARHVPGVNAEQFDRLLDEIRALVKPPTELPPKLRRLPLVDTPPVRKLILRIYERIFRKQMLVNAKLVDALQLLKLLRQ